MRQLDAPDRARIEALIARLIDLLDAYDAPSADMEPDWDHEADADDERSLQPATLTPYAEHRLQPFPGWDALEAAGLAEGVVLNRSGSKPRRMMIEGELVR
ncbi:hypothetical protein [Roseomonas sp. KE0001]|uniref:hypothetical protein n=1 Tax=Roseomonas sp. KE0001 TaxID=2479201 RepID=UPI0018DF584C|nr:hypothetical protein [Roseomonas sp. KE0001]